jgi:hypothetical protein
MTAFEQKLEQQTTAPERAANPKHSKRETFILALKVAGIAALVLGAIWVIEFLKG